MHILKFVFGYFLLNYPNHSKKYYRKKIKGGFFYYRWTLFTLTKHSGLTIYFLVIHFNPQSFILDDLILIEGQDFDFLENAGAGRQRTEMKKKKSNMVYLIFHEKYT